jgi:hypothetical protein
MTDESEIKFFSDRLAHGTETVKQCIDVSYVENLKKFYIAMWGEQRL